MLESVAAADLLKNFCGAAPAPRGALANVIVRALLLVGDVPEIVELDLNPIFVTESSAIAAEIPMVLGEGSEPPCRPAQEDILKAMTRIMNPRSVA